MGVHSARLIITVILLIIFFAIATSKTQPNAPKAPKWISLAFVGVMLAIVAAPFFRKGKIDFDYDEPIVVKFANAVPSMGASAYSGL